MSVDDLTLELNHPMTEEEMDHLLDVDLEHTNEVEFKTKHGKRVIFVRKQSCLMTKGGWISVKDRLPKTGSLALVYGSLGAMTVARYIARNDWVVPGLFSTITHWMPLPEPPKG